MEPPILFETLVTTVTPLIGFLLGETFSDWDETVQGLDWFKGSSPFRKYLTRKLMDLFHHWQSGALLMILSYPQMGLFASFNWVLWVLGFGLFISDIRDFENLKRRYATQAETKVIP